MADRRSKEEAVEPKPAELNDSEESAAPSATHLHEEATPTLATGVDPDPALVEPEEEEPPADEDTEPQESGLFKLAGWMWSPNLVGWGSPGRTVNQDLRGYYAKKLVPGQGKLSDEQRDRQTVNIWSEPGIYALYRGDSLLYVGQAIALGKRLNDHRKDHLAGRWDAFSWVSPTELISVERDGATHGELRPAIVPFTLQSVADLLNELEAFGIFVGRPIDNRQQPKLGQNTKWLTQRRSNHAKKTLEEMVEELYSRGRTQDER